MLTVYLRCPVYQSDRLSCIPLQKARPGACVRLVGLTETFALRLVVPAVEAMAIGFFNGL